MKNLVSLQCRRSLWGTAMGVILAALSLALPAALAQGPTVIATVPVGRAAYGMMMNSVAVNPTTNKIYVANLDSNNVTVIDGATNSTTTVTDPNAIWPITVAVNPATNKIYVANNGSGNVTVIDGATNSTTTVTDPNASGPWGVAVNSVTNKIYVANYASSNNVTVIDGATNSTTTVTDPNAKTPYAVAVNPVTNKIYVGNWGSANVTVIDGPTNSTTTVTDSNATTDFHPRAVAVNPATNKIYVGNDGSYNVTVIDGATNSTTTVTVGSSPVAVAVNPVTNKIYVADGDIVIVIDGATNSTTTVTGGNSPVAVAVNPVTNKIYVANFSSSNVTVIDGATNSTTTVTDPNANGPQAVAVNAVTDRIYVVNGGSNNVTVIDGGAPPITLSPPSLNFGNQLLNTTSQPKTVTLTNTSDAAVNISSIGITGPSGSFSETNNCGSSVLAGASCAIAVTFRPTSTSTSAETGTLTITDDASGSPQTAKLSGFGTVVTLSVKSLNFGDQPVGTTSSAQTITITNHATSLVVSIAGITISGLNSPAFAQTNTCGTSLAEGASCTISVTFTPHSKGSKTATLNVWANGGGGSRKVTLTGNGT